MNTPQPARTTTQAHAPKARPDARPMRLALSAGGLAAMSALAAAIVLPPRPATQASGAVQQPAATVDPLANPTAVQVQRPIQYVRLLPGQTAPPGATVIDPSEPTPITMTVTVPAPTAQAPAAQKPAVIRTTASGKVIP